MPEEPCGLCGQQLLLLDVLLFDAAILLLTTMVLMFRVHHASLPHCGVASQLRTAAATVVAVAPGRQQSATLLIDVHHGIKPFVSAQVKRVCVYGHAALLSRLLSKQYLTARAAC